MPWTKLDLPTEDEMRRMDAEYRGRVRFLVDESMGEQVAQILRSEAFNVRYAGDVGLIGRSDEDVFAEAWRDNRVIVTHDPDFLDNSRFPPHRNPGVVLIRPGSSGRDNRGLQVCLIKTPYCRRPCDLVSRKEARLFLRRNAYHHLKRWP